ncbi:ECF-type sigma factor, partial [Alteromonas lipotrueae]
MEDVHLRDTSGEFTEVLNAWVINNDLKSANQLRSIVYYHLKGMVKKQISKKAESDNALSLLDKLPNTTSLLHDVIIKLTAPDEIFENRQQFYASLAVFVRWMLQDEIKKRSAKKRNSDLEDAVQITDASIDAGLYLSFDNALSSLENVSKRCYQIALL